MKGTRRSKVWLALGLVAMACLVLAGCPHNGLLDNSGTGGGNGAGGSRGGSDGVQLVITNFVSEAPTASQTEKRSASWLSGPQRTIAPEHIDLTNPDEASKFVFVAYGNGSGTYGPEFINVAAGTGTAGLSISGSGIWEITVEAYDVTKLVAGGVTGSTKQDIEAQNDPSDIINRRDDAMVTSGSAILDLTNSNQVAVTLTNDKAGTTGEVDIAINFTNQNDFQEIFTPTSKYIVSAALVNRVTQAVVMVGGEGTNQTLYDKVLTQVDLDAGGGGYEYRKYDKSTKQYSTERLTTGTSNKVLRYNPKSAVGQTPIKVPKGQYVLLVTVENTEDDTTLYRADYDFQVEGNRTTTGAFTIDGILGVKPVEPSGLDVYWYTPTTTDTLVGYNADIVWGESDYNAVGYTLEIADISSIYKFDGTDTQVEVNGKTFETFTSAETLWAILDTPAKITDKTKYVTTLDWKTTPQDHNAIPRWVSGSLLGGNTTLSLRLETGKVYTARIRADNGSNSFSGWRYIGTGATVQPQPGGTVPTKFNIPANKGIFDLLKFSYMLKGTDMWILNTQRADMKVNTVDDRQVEGEDFLQIVEYDPATPAVLKYSFEGSTVSALQDDAVLVDSDDLEFKIVQSWLGWKNTKDGSNQLFGPTLGTAPGGGGWTKVKWSYDGFNDLDLEPVGAGGSSIKLQSETAGTFDVLNLNTIGFGIATPNATTNISTLAGLTTFAQQTAAGIYRNGAGTSLVIVIQRDRTQATVQYTDIEFFVSVGDKDQAGDKITSVLKDKNGNEIKISNVEVFFEKNRSKFKTGSAYIPATADVPAYSAFNTANNNALMGMLNGQYTLRVVFKAGQGYTPEFQLPVFILYTDQAATANIP